jgi:hypothetical protein
MVLTRSQARAAFNYILDNVLGKDNKSPLKSALLCEGINDIFSLVTFPLEYINDQDILKNVQTCDKNLLCYFSEYIVFRHANNDPINDDWMSVTPESFHSFCKNHDISFITSHEAVADEIMMEVSYEQPYGIIGNSDGEELMEVEVAPVDTPNGEKNHHDHIAEMESESESEVISKNQIVQKQKMMDEPHMLFRKYQKALDSLQNAMEVMEAKWAGNCPDSVYYSDESSDDSSVQVSWATGMNTEVALRNGEADWVVFKKKEARVQYAKQCWMESLKREQCDLGNFKIMKPDLPVEISYTSSDCGKQEGLTSKEITGLSEEEQEEDGKGVYSPRIMGLLPNKTTGSSRPPGNLFMINNQTDHSSQREHIAVNTECDSECVITSPISGSEGIT